MIGKPGVTYAQIVAGKVHWLFTADEMPEWADVTDDPPPAFGIQVIEAAEGVEVGDLYTGRFDKPAPVVRVPQVPKSVSRFQAKAALLNAGLLPAVEAAMAQAPAVQRLAWSDALEFYRQSPTVLSMSAALGLTAKQVDDLFIAAQGIEA